MPPWFVPGPFPAEFPTDERCFITEHLNLAESPEASLALARVAPGVTTRLHAVQGTIERYIILKGNGPGRGRRRNRPGRPGDRVIIPAGVPQRITNTGADDLEFYCLCTPALPPGGLPRPRATDAATRAPARAPQDELSDRAARRREGGGFRRSWEDSRSSDRSNAAPRRRGSARPLTAPSRRSPG